MTEDDFEEEFADEEDELFNDDEESEDFDEDESYSAEEEGFMKGYKESAKRKTEEEEI